MQSLPGREFVPSAAELLCNLLPLSLARTLFTFNNVMKCALLAFDTAHRAIIFPCNDKRAVNTY